MDGASVPSFVQQLETSSARSEVTALIRQVSGGVVNPRARNTSYPMAVTGGGLCRPPRPAVPRCDKSYSAPARRGHARHPDGSRCRTCFAAARRSGATVLMLDEPPDEPLANRTWYHAAGSPSRRSTLSL